MDKLILGLLVLKRLTVYEIRVIIKRNFADMCSDSLGSIQAAVKKLLAAQMVIFSEYVEKGKNKKRYSITKKGRCEFQKWVQTPAEMTKTKNMELGKLLFMGIVPAGKRPRLLDETVKKLDEHLANLLELQSSLSPQKDVKKQAVAYWLSDPEYRRGILAAAEKADINKCAVDIEHFQLLTLQYGIDNVRFELEWFKNLREKTKKEKMQEKKS